MGEGDTEDAVSSHAECTWGDGPDVLVVVVDTPSIGYPFVLMPDGNATFGLTRAEARGLAAELLIAAETADDYVQSQGCPADLEGHPAPPAHAPAEPSGEAPPDRVTLLNNGFVASYMVTSPEGVLLTGMSLEWSLGFANRLAAQLSIPFFDDTLDARRTRRLLEGLPPDTALCPTCTTRPASALHVSKTSSKPCCPRCHDSIKEAYGCRCAVCKAQGVAFRYERREESPVRP